MPTKLNTTSGAWTRRLTTTAQRSARMRSSITRRVAPTAWPTGASDTKTLTENSSRNITSPTLGDSGWSQPIPLRFTRLSMKRGRKHWKPCFTSIDWIFTLSEPLNSTTADNQTANSRRSKICSSRKAAAACSTILCNAVRFCSKFRRAQEASERKRVELTATTIKFLRHRRWTNSLRLRRARLHRERSEPGTETTDFTIQTTAAGTSTTTEVNTFQTTAGSTCTFLDQMGRQLCLTSTW